MTQTKDIHIESLRLQKEIESYIGLTSNSISFDYHEEDNRIKLNLITVNPIHRQSFLFHTTTGYDKIDALSNYKERESSYTIQWCLKDDKNLHTSYFRAKNIYNALDKLYFSRDPNSIIVFSVVMNPIS
jgi:hypothetical protein